MSGHTIYEEVEKATATVVESGRMHEEVKVVEKKAGGFFSEFWKFAARGNVFDLAVAVILGNAFSAVVNALVSDIITPLLSLLTRNVNLNTFAYEIRARSSDTPPVVLGYGHLLQVAVNFLIIALSI